MICCMSIHYISLFIHQSLLTYDVVMISSIFHSLLVICLFNNPYDILFIQSLLYSIYQSIHPIGIHVVKISSIFACIHQSIYSPILIYNVVMISSIFHSLLVSINVFIHQSLHIM